MSTDPQPNEPSRRDSLRVLLLSCLVGIPVSLLAFAFLALLHKMGHLIWHELPDELGMGDPDWWWPIPWLALGGVLAGAAIRSLPGKGGHVPIDGLGAEPVIPRELPGILLAALACLPLGAVLGPEAPLIALGTGSALLIARAMGLRQQTGASGVVGLAGATAAVAAIFGSPLAALVLMLEMVSSKGALALRAIAPCMLAAGTGSLVFTGLGRWTGLQTVSLGLPDLSGPARPDLADLLWTVPFAIVIAVAVREVHQIGHWVADRARTRPFTAAVSAALTVAVCASAYALITDRSPAELVMSGQDELPELAAQPGSWATGALIALIAFKAIAYGVSLGALRGGPIFPALFLGAAAGTLCAELPGYGAVPALAAGMAAATAAILPMPVSSAVLVTLLLGPNAVAMSPIVLIAVVVAFISEQVIDRPHAAEPAADG